MGLAAGLLSERSYLARWVALGRLALEDGRPTPFCLFAELYSLTSL